MQHSLRADSKRSQIHVRQRCHKLTDRNTIASPKFLSRGTKRALDRLAADRLSWSLQIHDNVVRKKALCFRISGAAFLPELHSTAFPLLVYCIVDQ